MTKPVVWRLHCAVCNWAPAADQPISDAKDHWDEHTDEQRASFDGFSLNLVPHCPEDDAPYALSESGDSGQCPACGRFDILRVPEEYR
jgi:hypothetical protein